MTITQELQTLLNTKGEIRQAIIDKGVAVAENAPFDSYADKISQISGGSGGSSVAEYVYENITEEVAFPRKPSTESTDYMFTDGTSYKESSLEFSCYEPNANIERMSYFFDENLATYGNMINGLFFKFDKPVLLKKLYVYNDGGYEITLRGTNNSEIATSASSDLWEVIYTGGAESYDIDLESKEYQYYYLSKNSGYKTIYELKFYAVVGNVTCTLKSHNMTPSFKCYPDEYMQVITQDWYNGSKIVPSQTLTFKPYEDGGCLVNYTDDGKAVNLKMFYLKSNGELVGKIYNNFTVSGTLNIDENTGIAKGFTNINTIELPIALSSDNWQFSIKANYQNVSRHQGLFYDKNLSRNFGEIHSTTQTMSSYITGSWTDGTVALDDRADYWFLFDFSNGVLTSYVKKDNNYISCPSKENMDINFTIQGLSSFSGHQVGLGNADSGEQWESTVDLSTAVLVENGVEVWNAATKVALKDIYVLAPDNTFTLEGYSEKTQIADMNIPAHSVPGVGAE